MLSVSWRTGVLAAAVLALATTGQAEDKKEETVAVIRDWKGNTCGEKKKQRVVIKDEKGWKEVWGKIDPKTEPKIDFEKEMAIALFVGEHSSNASISISTKVTKVLKTDKGLTVFVESQQTNGGAARKDSIAIQPYLIVVVPKDKGEVKFEEKDLPPINMP